MLSRNRASNGGNCCRAAELGAFACVRPGCSDPALAGLPPIIELVSPGVARQLRLGEDAVLVACNNGGTRIWAVLGRWTTNRSSETCVDGFHR